MKHTRKKIYAGLMAALLMLSLLAGCGGNPAGNAADNPSGGDAGESQSGGGITRNSPGESPEPAAPHPVLGYTTNEDNHYDDDLSAMVNSMETELPGVNAETRENYPELAAALDHFREDALNAAREDYQEREDMLPEFLERNGDGGYGLYGETCSIIRRADAKAVSVVNVRSEYAGGAHPNYSYAAATFDAATGEKIALESLLTDEGAETLNARLGEELDALYPDLTPGGNIAEYAPEDYAFSVEPDGVTFWFGRGEIASPACDGLTVKLYFVRDADILNGAYQGTDEAWFVELGEDAYRFTAANGNVETVEPWSVVRMAAEDTDVLDCRAFYAHIPHGDYIVVILDMEDDNHDILVYRCDGKLIQRLYRTSPETFFYPEPPEEEGDMDWENYSFYHASLTNPDDTRLYAYSGLFGSWEAGGSYRLTDSGFQLQQELLYGNGFTLTLEQDFTVARCDPDEWTVTTDEVITIPAGTEVNVVAANPEQTTAYFRVENPARLTNDDREFIFALSYDDSDNVDGEWQTVDGIPENELFDGLQYAG